LSGNLRRRLVHEHQLLIAGGTAAAVDQVSNDEQAGRQAAGASGV